MPEMTEEEARKKSKQAAARQKAMASMQVPPAAQEAGLADKIGAGIGEAIGAAGNFFGFRKLKKQLKSAEGER